MTQKIREVLHPNSLFDPPTNAVDANGDVVPLEADNYIVHSDETSTTVADESPLERGKRLAREMLDWAATVREQNPIEELPSDDNREMYRRPSTNTSNNQPTSETKKVYCGDCGLPIPCAHTNGRRTFGH